jgi:hypothetical protein
MPNDAHSPSASDRPRIQTIQVQGISIVTMDFSDASPADTLSMLEEYPRIFVGREPDSVRLLTNVTGLTYDSSVSNKWKSARIEYDSYVLATAIYGVSGLVGVAVRSFTEVALWLGLPNAQKKIKVFATREKALAWLLEQ